MKQIAHGAMQLTPAQRAELADLLLTLPGAAVLSIEEGRLREVSYRDTEHFKLTRDFLNSPERYHRHLFRDESDSLE